MNTRDNILIFIDKKNISKREFYKKTSLSNGFLDKSSSIGSTNIEKIIEAYPEINLHWLITGEGEMLNSDLSKQAPAPKGIPLVSVTAIAGFGNGHFAISDRDVKEYYVIPKFKHKQIDFMIEVEGSSMYPKYSSGDVVACRIISEESFIQWNKTHVVATHSQGIIIKRLKQTKTKTAYTMVSDNPDYPEFDVPQKEISGIALVVGVVRLE